MPTLVLIEKAFAAIVVLACVVLLVRQFIGARRRLRFDAVVTRNARRLRTAALRAWRWPAAHRRAAREAQAAIRRARGERARHADDDNVVRPKFGNSNSRKLH